jgi:hypothetical protein
VEANIPSELLRLFINLGYHLVPLIPIIFLNFCEPLMMTYYDRELQGRGGWGLLDILLARALNSQECQTLIKEYRRKGRNPGKST